jgi:hypothetical protein
VGQFEISWGLTVFQDVLRRMRRKVKGTAHKVPSLSEGPTGLEPVSHFWKKRVLTDYAMTPRNLRIFRVAR